MPNLPNPLKDRAFEKSSFVSFKRPLCAEVPPSVPVKVSRDELKEKQMQIMEKEERLLDVRLKLYEAKLKVLMKDRPDVFVE